MLLDELLDPALLYTIPDIGRCARDLRARLDRSAARRRRSRTRSAARVQGDAPVPRRGVRVARHPAVDERLGLSDVPRRGDSAGGVAARLAAHGGATAAAPRDGVRDHRLRQARRPRTRSRVPTSTSCSCTTSTTHHNRFLHRMVRRLLHILTTRTHTGALYDVDTRLRPSGRRRHDGELARRVRAYQQQRRVDVGASGAGARATGRRRSPRCAMRSSAFAARFCVACATATSCARDRRHATPHRRIGERRRRPQARAPAVSWISSLWSNTSYWPAASEHPIARRLDRQRSHSRDGGDGGTARREHGGGAERCLSRTALGASSRSTGHSRRWSRARSSRSHTER